MLFELLLILLVLHSLTINTGSGMHGLQFFLFFLVQWLLDHCKKWFPARAGSLAHTPCGEDGSQGPLAHCTPSSSFDKGPTAQELLGGTSAGYGAANSLSVLHWPKPVLAQAIQLKCVWVVHLQDMVQQIRYPSYIGKNQSWHRPYSSSASGWYFCGRRLRYVLLLRTIQVHIRPQSSLSKKLPGFYQLNYLAVSPSYCESWSCSKSKLSAPNHLQ